MLCNINLTANRSYRHVLDDNNILFAVYPVGYYMFTDASYQLTGDRAWMYSDFIPPTQTSCIGFWYYMYGAGKPFNIFDLLFVTLYKQVLENN